MGAILWFLTFWVWGAPRRLCVSSRWYAHTRARIHVVLMEVGDGT